MTDRDQCGNTAAEMQAAIRAIEAARDSSIRSLATGGLASAGVIARYQKDIAALKALEPLVHEEAAHREWAERKSTPPGETSSR